MTKIQKSLTLALVASLAIAIFPYHPSAENMLFSGFSLGWSSRLENNRNNQIEILDEDTEITYSFRISEWLMELFD